MLIDRHIINGPDYFRVPDAAKALACSISTVQRAIERGDIRTIRFGAHVRVPLSEIQRVRAATARAAESAAIEPGR